MPKENLKKSKSEEQINLIPPVQLERSKSAEPKSINDPKYPYTTLISQGQEIEVLRKESETKSTTINLLRKKIGELEKSSPPLPLLQGQLAEKQKEVEELRAELEGANNSLSSLSKERQRLRTQLEAPNRSEASELDQALFARHRNLKD